MNRADGNTAFGRQMHLAPTDAPGRYVTQMDAMWNCPLVSHGGTVTALAVSAMAQELDVPVEHLRSVTAVFAAPVNPGPVEIEVAVLRRGRSVSQASATVRDRDAETGHTLIAVFGAERPSFEFTELDRPDVPSPQDAVSWRTIPAEVVRRGPHNPYWDHVEGRTALGHRFWDQWTPTGSLVANWFRFSEPPMRGDGVLDPLAVVALCDTMPGAVSERMGPGQAPWYGLSADLTVHLLAPARSEWILSVNRARHASGGYASVEVELWDEYGSLVAYGTEILTLHFPEGPPATSAAVVTQR
jgi:acyl-CoA thioesterase